MRLRNIPSNIPIYLRRAYYSRRNSSPFLSGDFFADLADVSLFDSRFPIHKIELSRISNAEVVFCTSDNVERMLADFKHILRAKVLIIGNGDRDFHDFDFHVPNTVKRIFLQNQLFRSSRVEPLPIGIENLRLGRNGLPSLFSSETSSPRRRNQVLVGPFSPTHVERQELLQKVAVNQNNLLLVNDYIDPKVYSSLSFSCTHIACPRGNGFDTHRVWESLYRGAVPILKESLWATHFGKLGIPLIQVSDWDEMMSDKFLKIYVDSGSRPNNVAALWADYWIQRIKSHI